MAFREVSVVQVREALRGWLHGDGERPIARRAGIDRKTARRYIAAAIEVGVDRDGGEEQLSDELIGQIFERMRPGRPDGHGESWRRLLREEEQIKAWLKQELTVVKIGILLRRRGVEVPPRTLARFAVERCGAGRRSRTTTRVDDPPPGIECQVDFGRLGLVADGDRRRVCWALIFTACYSRHQFVWPTFSQTIEEVIRGFEAAWSYFGGVFPVVIPDSMKAIVEHADDTEPRFNDTFMEYAQARGFVVDPARIRHPKDKPRVERVVPYTRRNFFAGEDFVDLPDCRMRGEVWCTTTAGMRVHGTTQCHPIEVFRAEEVPRLLPAPGQPFDVPRWSTPWDGASPARPEKTPWSALHRPGRPAHGQGDLRHPGPRPAAGHGRGGGRGHRALAAQLLDTPLPWTKMRQVYRLLGLVKKWGAERVESACAKALISARIWLSWGL